MISIRFKSDFRGRLTGEVFYVAGSVASFPDHIARALVGYPGGWVAEFVEDDGETEELPAAAPEAKPRRSRRK